MRRSFSFGLFATLGASLVACTALLGDFSVGAGSGPGADGGGDVTSTDDARSDATADAAPDAPPSPPLLKCGVNGSPVDLITGIAGGSERLGLHAFKAQGNGKRRTMWTTNGMNEVNFVTIDEKLSAASILKQGPDLGAPVQEQVSYDGGFAAIGLSFKNTTHLSALRFDDSAVNPTDPVDITGNLLPASVSDLSIAAAPVGGDDFFVAFTYSTGPNVWSMYAGRARIATGASPGSFKLVSGNITARPSLDSDALVIDKPDGRAILFVKADMGQGATTIVQMDLASGAAVGTPQPLLPVHGTSTFEPLAAQTDIAPGVDRVGLAFLEYDLNTPNAPFYVYAGSVPALGFGGFKATLLPPPVMFTKPSDIAVDKGRAFWKHYAGAGSHVVETARVTQTGKGVNFLWLDGAGNLRGKASGADALVTGDVVMGAAGTMVDAPNAVVANAAIAWLTDTGALRIANIGCAR